MGKNKVGYKNESILNESSDLAARAYRGLCSTCRHSEVCNYLRYPHRPVIQCEEFEGIIGTSDKTTNADPKPVCKMNSKIGQESKQYQGICKICEKRETCTFPKPEGGVWHCDECE